MMTQGETVTDTAATLSATPLKDWPAGSAGCGGWGEVRGGAWHGVGGYDCVVVGSPRKWRWMVKRDGSVVVTGLDRTKTGAKLAAQIAACRLPAVTP